MEIENENNTPLKEEQKKESSTQQNPDKIIEDSEKKEEFKNDINQGAKPESKEDENSQIESFLKKKFNKVTPTIYIEYPKTKDILPISKLDLENLKNILNKFGKINFIEIYHLISLVQYDTFLSAYSCIKYFEKISQNKQDKIICRWFEEKDEEIVSEDILAKIKKLKPYEIVDNINKSMKNYYMKKQEKNNEFSEIQDDDENIEKENILTDGIAQLEYYSIFCLSKKAQKEFNEIISINKARGIKNMELSYNINPRELNMNNNATQVNINNNEKGNIKYICKFYLQIEGDKDFQVIKRIIGAKGCNLKRIIDYCSKGPGGVYVPDAIKLKLKGVGSGYRERDGDKKEPLNLCVISKYQDKYKKACSFVIELIINIYEEYKRFCERKRKDPINSLNIQKVEYISTRGC